MEHCNAKLLRIFIGESDHVGQTPLYEAVVFEAKKQGLSGATVTRGIMGFGANSVVHITKLFEISSDLPLVVEIVDSEEHIRAFIPVIERLFMKSGAGGLITLEHAEVIHYRPTSQKLSDG
jgi:PII-like signaling protein